MLKVGLTGGIGSGKSTIAKIFGILGVPVYFADDRSKYLLNNSYELIDSVCKTFGMGAYSDGRLNQKYIASLVFSDKSKLNALNRIAHPAVEKDFTEWCIRHKNADYILMEAAILFESKTYKLMDINLLVVAPEEIRIKRVAERDGVSLDQIKERMNNQWPTEKLTPLADIIIENDDKKLILPQILKIHKDLHTKWQNLVNG
jgi:dephospho-CoA kinase